MIELQRISSAPKMLFSQRFGWPRINNPIHLGHSLLLGGTTLESWSI